MKSTRLIFWMGAPILVLAISGWLITRAFREGPAPHIKTRVILRDIRQSIRGVGILQASEVIPVEADLDGELVSLRVSEGQTIQKGHRLFRIKNFDLRQEFRLLQAQYRQAETELRKILRGPDEQSVGEAKNELNRNERLLADLEHEYREKKELLQNGFISQKEMEELETKIEAAKEDLVISKEKYQQVTRPLSTEDIELKKAEVSKMEFELDKLSRKYASRQARSEREGYVLEVLKDRGDRVKEADVILNLVDLSRPFIVDGMVFESEVSSLKKGQTAFIKIPGFKDSFKAELSEISLVARPMGNMKKFPIKLVLHEKMEGTIRLGVSAHFDIVIGEAKQVPVLPIQFIEEKDRIKGVWKDAGSKLQFIPIQLGLSDTSFVEIKEGLEPGDAVVLPSTQKAAP